MVWTLSEQPEYELDAKRFIKTVTLCLKLSKFQENANEVIRDQGVRVLIPIR